jgi:hypothetical protein
LSHVAQILQVGGPVLRERMSHSVLWGHRDSFSARFLPINRMILPAIARHTIGVVAVGARRYIDWLGALWRFVVVLGWPLFPSLISLIDAHFSRYIALVAWTAAIWISYNPLIDSRQEPNGSPKSKTIIAFIGKFLFGIYLCAALLLFEKFSIQWIAAKFHERSYAGQEIWLTLHVQLTKVVLPERIAEQKFAVRTLTTLYRHSTDVHESRGHPHDEKQPMINPKRIVKQAIRGVRFAATTTTTALGNVASEIAGRWVLSALWDLKY